MFFRKYVLGFLLWLIYRTLSLTWRVHLVEPAAMTDAVKNRNSFIMAHLHGDELAVACLTKRYRMATIISTSSDGELMNTVIHLLGGKTTRGSSTRGGASALKGLIKHAKNGSNTSFAVDGPKGPIFKVKPGVFELSRLMKVPIYWSGVSCDRAWIFEKSWNKAFLPKPFAHVHVIWNGPIGPIGKDQDPRSEALALDFESALRNARTDAFKKLQPATSNASL